MAFFNIRQWLDRISEHPNRRTLTNVEDPTDVKTYDLSRAEGEITTQGTALTGANLTDLENRIGAAFTAVEQAMPEANPAAEATASLTKLKVAGTVYEIEGGGGEPQTGTIEDVAVASFSDGADNVPVSELIVDINPVQYLHGYDKPWVGGAGKNKLPNTATSQTVNGVTYTVNSDGSVTANGTSTGWDGFVIGTAVLEAGTYILSGETINEFTYVEVSIDGHNYNTANRKDSPPFTLSEQTSVTAKIFSAPQSTPSGVKICPMIRLASESDATYEPFSNICPITGHDSGVIRVDTDQFANIYKVDFGQTVYGGHLNVTTGELTITHKYQRGGFSRKSVDSSNKLWYCGDLSDSKEYASVEAPNAISNMFVGKSLENCRADNSGFTLFPKQLYIAGYVGNESALDALLSNLEIAYELATPFDIDLTPTEVRTLLNANNIYADTGNINKLVYFKTGCEAVAKLIEAYSERL
jgi:hypothetical protein